jgi:hypothetical protein
MNNDNDRAVKGQQPEPVQCSSDDAPPPDRPPDTFSIATGLIWFDLGNKP